MGGADMVSVYVRETLIQLWTPDHVRGRVNAVNGVFVGASNELGEFRAGVSAWLFGAVPAVVIGGIGTIAVTVALGVSFPGAAPSARHLGEGVKGREAPSPTGRRECRFTRSAKSDRRRTGRGR